MTVRKTAVIGGGAAGMMAGIFGAYSGDDITIFEKNQKIGRKIYITGKGRCNVTNNCDIKTVISNTPVNARFLYSALNRFSPADTMEFFESNGLPLKTERGNRVFPVSDKAGDVVDTLLRVSKKAGCKIVNKTVTDIISENGHVTGIKIENNFFLKKKVEREEKDLENNKNNKFSKFLDNSEEENSNNSEEEKNIKDIFKKPLTNFSKFKEKK